MPYMPINAVQEPQDQPGQQEQQDYKELLGRQAQWVWELRVPRVRQGHKVRPGDLRGRQARQVQQAYKARPE